MNAFVIEVEGEHKEAFAYEGPLNEVTVQALVEYAKATYGRDAKIRRMSQQEEHEFKTTGIEFFKGRL